MGKGMLWDILIQYILPILLIGLGILALVLIILTVVFLVYLVLLLSYCKCGEFEHIDCIKDWIKEWRE